MKKLIFVLILFALLPLITSAEIEINSQFDQGETLIAKVSGNFIDPILDENVFFYREETRVPVDFDIFEIDEEFYIYGLLENKQEANYSLRIEEVRYYQGAEVVEEDIMGPFKITNSTADFSTKPGFVVTDEPFSIEVQNLQLEEITIQISDIASEQISVTLKSGEITDLDFGLGDETSFRFITLSSDSTEYEIPVYAFVENPSSQTSNNESENDPEEENATEIENEDENVTEENEDSQEEIIKSATTKTCAELEGNVCSENQECSGNSEYSKDAVCCIGICEEIEESNSGKIIGWILVAIIVATLFWFFKTKYRKAKSDVDLFKIARGKRR